MSSSVDVLSKSPVVEVPLPVKGISAVSSVKWETSSDPGDGSGVRTVKKKNRDSNSVDTYEQPFEAPVVENEDEEKGTMPIVSISTASSAHQTLDLPHSESVGGLFYVGQSSNSNLSLQNSASQSADMSDDLPSASASNLNSLKRKPMESAMKVIQSYISPSYFDQDAEFRKIFDTSITDTDRLIFVTSAAINREFLYSGKLYISQNHICFYSMMFKTALVVVPFNEIIKMKKEKVLRMVPTAIEVVKRNGERCTFFSVSQRDLVFQLMFELWQTKRSGMTLSNQEIDQKIRQLNGQLNTGSSPSNTVALDIRWRTSSQDEDIVDFLPPTNTAADDGNNNDEESNKTSVGEIGESMNDEVDQQEGILTEESPKTDTENSVDNNKQRSKGFEKNRDISGPLTGELRRRGRISGLPHHLVHSESVVGVESTMVPSSPLARCRSRSTSSERKNSQLEPSHYKGVRQFATNVGTEEPTPTPTPSPSPGHAANDHLPYPPNDFLPCRHHNHLKRVIFDQEFPLPPDVLINVIFGPGDSYDLLMKRYGGNELDLSDWEPQVPEADEAVLQRKEMPPPLGFDSVRSGTYTLQLGWAVGPRYANLIEKHTVYAESRPGVFYVAERHTRAPGMPYGKDFHTVWRYCIRRLPPRYNEKIVRSRVTLTGEVRYDKPVWRAFQGIIERNAQTGVDTFVTLLRVILDEEAEKYAANVTISSASASVGLTKTPNAPPRVSQVKANDGGHKKHQQHRKSSSVSQHDRASKHAPFTDHSDVYLGEMRTDATLSLPVHVRLDNWLNQNPQLTIRVLLFSVVILLCFTLFLSRRVAELEEHLLRYGSPFHYNSFADPTYAQTFQASPELGSVLSQLSNIAGQMSDSLTVIAEGMRNQQLNQPGDHNMGVPSSPPPPPPASTG